MNQRSLFVIPFLCTGLFYSCKTDPMKTVPLLSYRLSDSVTVANTSDIPKGKPFVLFHFEEDCVDCQKTTDSLIQQINLVQNIHFYFLSRDNFHRLNKFCQHFHFDQYPNITIGQDYDRKLPHHYNSYITPLIALFDSNKRLVEIYSGKPNNQELINSLKSLQ